MVQNERSEEILAMKDLRDTSYAYRKAWKIDKGNEDEFNNLFNEIDTNNDNRISFNEFKTYMTNAGHKKYGSDKDFFEKLTRDGKDYLVYGDVVLLVYIINSGRPFCNECDYFIQGTFFTCVKCFETEKDLHYNICPRCYDLKGKNHNHNHKEFLDTLSLLRLNAKRGSVKPSSSAQKIKPTKMKKQSGLLELMQVAAGCATIAAAVSQCNIM